MYSAVEKRKKKLISVLSFVFIVRCQGAAGGEGPQVHASSVTVEQANTGEKAGYDPVFEVTVRNGCGCAVRGVYLRSEGFSSLRRRRPAPFRRDGRHYLIGDGRRIGGRLRRALPPTPGRAFRMTPPRARTTAPDPRADDRSPANAQADGFGCQSNEIPMAGRSTDSGGLRRLASLCKRELQ
ncbi:hypothetical protein HU200_066908 [Digitaria exilis]|uniref:Uncharacterized protein n=1 Tax=Digitaria exilis TaxID=1010633 RepID=A0A835A5V4_9POAL|nr:hypothetical protein HU200_066908 [Digitaria exilis]